MRWRGAFAALITVCATACSNVIGLGDLQRDQCVGDACDAVETDGKGDKPSEQGSSGSLETPGTQANGSSGSTTPANNGLPSFCNGAVLYLSMDGTLVGAKGEAPQQVGGNWSYDAPKHGNGGLLIQEAQFNYSDVLSTDVGTIAVWLAKPKCLGEAQKRIYLDSIGLRGPIMQCDPSNGSLGVVFSNGSLTAQAMLGSEGSTNNFDFVATTWQKAMPAVSFMLWNAAGQMKSATSGSAPLPGLSPGKMSLRVGNNAPPGPNASYDDLVAWNRTLSVAELDALRTSGKSFGANCKL